MTDRAAILMLGALTACGSGAPAQPVGPDALSGSDDAMGAADGNAVDVAQADAADSTNASDSPERADVIDAGGDALLCGDASCAAGQLCMHSACPGGPPGLAPCYTPPAPQCIDLPDACATASCGCLALRQACGAGGCGSVEGAAVYCAPSQ